MAEVLVVYCSMSGNTRAAAEAVAAGARRAGAQAILKTGVEARPEDLLVCGAVAFGSYDAFGYMGGGLKDFFDRAYYPTKGKVAGRPYAAFVTHGGGGSAVGSIDKMAGWFKLKKAADAVLVTGMPDGAALDELEEVGAKLAAAAQR